MRNRSGFVGGLQRFTFEHHREMNVTKINLRPFDSQAVLWKSLLRLHQKALLFLPNLVTEDKFHWVFFWEAWRPKEKNHNGSRRCPWWCPGYCTFLDFYTYFCFSLFLMKTFRKLLHETVFLWNPEKFTNSQVVRNRKTNMIGYGGLSSLGCEPHWGFWRVYFYMGALWGRWSCRVAAFFPPVPALLSLISCDASVTAHMAKLCKICG